MSVIWEAVGNRGTITAKALAERDRLSDAARGGDWFTVLAIVESNAKLVNVARVGGTSGYSPLHQVAWHGAPEAVARQLIGAGAWRTLRTTGGEVPGETAHGIAQRRGHHELLRTLQPEPIHIVPASTLTLLRGALHDVIRQRREVQRLIMEQRLRLPELEPLTELNEPSMWFPVPGFYGGFKIELLLPERDSAEHAELEVTSWCRIVGGSGQRHRVRVDGAELVEEGFV